MTLNPRITYGDLDLTDYPFLFEFGADLGRPENMSELLGAVLADGDVPVGTRAGNRELNFSVLVEEADLQALAEAEPLLTAEADKQRNTLTIDPGDGIAVPSVYDTYRAQVTQVRDEDLEMNGYRRYTVTVPAYPFTRSEALTTVGSEFVADSDVIADDCESTTGWSLYGTGNSATITVDSTAGHFSTGTGAVKLVTEPYVYDTTATTTSGAWIDSKIRKSGLSIDASGGGYFAFRFRPEPGWTFNSYSASFYLTTSGGGRQAATLVASTAEDNGYTRYLLTVPHASTITTFELEGRMSIWGPWGSLFPNPGWWFDSLGLAGSASANQGGQSLTIEGSARSEGTLAVSAAVGLGDTLVYTCPDLGDGFRPDVRRFQTAGTSSADADAINGTYVPGNTGVFEVPASSLRAGAYAVLARVKWSSTTFTLTLDAQTVLDGTPIGQTYSVGGAITVPDTTNYHVVRVGVLELPPHRVDAAADAVVELSLGGSAIKVDEVLLFPLEDAALTWVACGSGTPSAAVASRLWIDAPSAQLPFGQVVAGTQADRSDARFIQPESKGRHLLYPGQMLAYVLTSAAGGADFSASYFMRWHTWAVKRGDE